MKWSLIFFGLILMAGHLIAHTLPARTETVALWLCDEGGGQTLRDSSGNGHHGAIKGRISWTEGKFGKALELHGKPDCVVVPGSAHLTGPTAMTVEMWLKAPQKTEYHSPISKGLRGPGHWEIFLLSTNGFFSAYIPDLGSFTGSKIVTDDQWHHCAMIWDGESVRLYVDGQKTDEWTKGLAGKQIIADDQELHIGNEFSNDTWHTGLLDEIRISNTALSVEELGFNKSFVSQRVDRNGKLSSFWGRIKMDIRER